MTTLTTLIVAVFVVGYFLIAIESLTKINKAAIALLMFVGCWTIFMVDPGQYLANAVGDSVPLVVSELIEKHLGSTATTLFFLMGAMTIVELVDQNGGFNFVRDMMRTKSKRGLLWRIACMTFLLSAILDNLTTSIVMIMILRKLVSDHKDRIIYASLVIIAANSGGAFSPIGDVTTIMLWNKGLISAAGVIKEMLIPSIVSMVIPAFILQYSLKGELKVAQPATGAAAASELTARQRKVIFFLGVGGLIFVPIFKSITHLPPFVGIRVGHVSVPERVVGEQHRAAVRVGHEQFVVFCVLALVSVDEGGVDAEIHRRQQFEHVAHVHLYPCLVGGVFKPGAGKHFLLVVYLERHHLAAFVHARCHGQSRVARVSADLHHRPGVYHLHERAEQLALQMSRGHARAQQVEVRGAVEPLQVSIGRRGVGEDVFFHKCGCKRKMKGGLASGGL